MRPALVSLLVLAMTAGIVEQAGAVTDAEVEAARVQLEQAQEEASAVAEQIEAAWSESARLDDQITSVEETQKRASENVIILTARAEDVTVRLYMDAAAGRAMAALLATGSEGFAAGLGYLEAIGEDDQRILDQLTAQRAELDRLRAQLDADRATQSDVIARFSRLSAEVQSTLAAALNAYDLTKSRRAEEVEAARRAAAEQARRAAEEAARRATSTTTTQSTTTTRATTTSSPTTTTSPESSTSTVTSTTSVPPTTSTTGTETTTTTTPPAAIGACPVDGPVSFIDSWGAPRSGGRTHQGVDMMAARGTPVAAIFTGVIRYMKNSRLGGTTIWMRSDAGDDYYYAHLDGYASGVSPGDRVMQGQTIAYVGSTGNAPAYLPHLHFEYHPNGGTAVNPFPLVKGICG